MGKFSLRGKSVSRWFTAIVGLVFFLPVFSIVYSLQKKGVIDVFGAPDLVLYAFAFCASLGGIELLRRTFVEFVTVTEAVKKVDAGRVHWMDTETLEAGEVSSSLKSIVAELERRKKTLEDLQKELGVVQGNLYHACRLSHLGEVTASIAHEINQPLNVIGLVSRSILMDSNEGIIPPLRPETEEKLVKIENQVIRMRKIIDQLRSFARMDADKTVEAVRVHDVLENALTIMGHQLRLLDIEIEKELSEDLPMVLANSVRLEQVFLNLIANAKDAIEGRPERKIKICGKTEGGNVIVEFIDNGGGVDKEIRNKIFKPFFTTKEKGMGLGLSISHGIVKDHGGELALDVVEGKGSIFRVTLPATAKNLSELR